MVAIVKYNAGNIQSVLFAMERLGVQAEVTDDPEKLMAADKVIFPGVGEAASAMRYLRERKLDEVIRQLRQPVLGICLGMQLLCRHSEEGDTRCIAVFDNNVQRFTGDLKVPQIGWNLVSGKPGSALFAGLEQSAYFYFVHSYFANLGTDTLAETTYIVPFSSALQKDNFYGVQFHPEKSAAAGERLLQNFLNL
jgi:glutamine amidotransferase